MGKKSKKGASRRTSSKKKTNNPSTVTKQKASKTPIKPKKVTNEDIEIQDENDNTTNGIATTESTTESTTASKISEITNDEIKKLEYARKRAEIQKRVAGDLAKRKEEEDRIAASEALKKEIEALEIEAKSVSEKADETISSFKEFKKKEEMKNNVKVEENIESGTKTSSEQDKIQKLAQENFDQIQKSAMDNVRNKALTDEKKVENAASTENVKESKEIVPQKKEVVQNKPQSIENSAEDLAIQKNVSTDTGELACGCAMACADESDDVKIDAPKQIDVENLTTMKDDLPKDMSSPENPENEKQDCACVIS